MLNKKDQRIRRSRQTRARIAVQRVVRLMVHRTTVVVAHRLSTIRRADAIVVVVRGRIVERGRHDELLARAGDYRQLYDRQFGADTDGAEPSQGT